MTDRELILAVTEMLRTLAEPLIDEGWRPELLVLAPEELGRIPGFKVALVVPIDTAPGHD